MRLHKLPVFHASVRGLTRRIFHRQLLDPYANLHGPGAHTVTVVAEDEQEYISATPLQVTVSAPAPNTGGLTTVGSIQAMAGRQFSAVLARDLEPLGAVRMKIVSYSGENQDGCMISAVLKQKGDSGLSSVVGP